MKGFLADTNIPSELTRPNPDVRVASFLKEAGKGQLYLSVLTLGEMRKGVCMLPIGNRRRLLEDWLETTLRPWFSTRILPITEPVAERWGVLAAEASSRGLACRWWTD